MLWQTPSCYVIIHPLLQFTWALPPSRPAARSAEEAQYESTLAGLRGETEQLRVQMEAAQARHTPLAGEKKL